MQQDPPSAVDAVRAFVAAWRRVRSRFRADYPGLDGIESLLRAVRSERAMPGEGRSASGIGYVVHGAGCRMTSQAGQVLDLDMARDPATGEYVEAFDAWRVRWFLDPGAGCPPLSQEIEGACLHLAREGELRQVAGHRGRWFALPG